MKIQFLDSARNRIKKYGNVEVAIQETKKILKQYQGVSHGIYYSYAQDETFINQEILYRLGQIKRGVFKNKNNDE